MKIRCVRLAVILTLLVMGVGCSNSNQKDLQAFLDQVAQFNDEELLKAVYGIDEISQDSRNEILEVVSILKAPSPEETLKIESVMRIPGFVMVVVDAPWPRERFPVKHLPILMTGRKGEEKILGYTLPFEPLASQLSIGELNEMFELTMWYAEAYGRWNGGVLPDLWQTSTNSVDE